MCWSSASPERVLVLHEHASDLYEVIEQISGPGDMGARAGRVLSLYFDDAEQARDVVREAHAHEWSIAGPSAIPNLAAINAPGGGITEDDTRDITTILHALPRFARSQRHSLLKEEKTGKQASIMWTDVATGAVFRYSGEPTRFPRVQPG